MVTFGSNLITDVLWGANTEKVRKFNFNSLSTYGIMHEYSKETIKSFIAFLETEEYIKTIGNEFPVLCLTEKANSVLFDGEKVLVKKKFEKANINKRTIGFSTDVDSTESDLEQIIPDTMLFNILRELRRDIAIRNNVPPYIVFPDTTLNEMAYYYPTNKQNMIAITGVGEKKFEQYGELFIEAILKYIKENNITPREKIVNSTYRASYDTDTQMANNYRTMSANEKNFKPKKERTQMITYHMFQSGLSIDEIAIQRNISKLTIEEHLIYCIELGIDIDIEKYIQTNYKDIILEAINKIGTERLKPIKEALPEEVSYLDIKYYIAKSKVKNDV